MNNYIKMIIKTYFKALTGQSSEETTIGNPTFPISTVYTSDFKSTVSRVFLLEILSEYWLKYLVLSGSDNYLVHYKNDDYDYD